MENFVMDSLAGLPDFGANFGAAIILVVLFCAIYLRVTPYAEIKLIREGKIAPAVSFSGSLLGFVIPLASAISQSVNLLDMVLWALIALVVQILVFIVLKIVFPHLVTDIPEDRMASAIMLGVCSLAAGIVNAACLTY